MKRLPRVVVGVRKTTPTDEELKIIPFSPSFVLHLINEVLRFIALGRLKNVQLVRIAVDLTPADVDVSLKDFPPASSETVLPFLPLPPSPVFVLSLLFTIFARISNCFSRDGIFFRKNKKVVQFFFQFSSVYTP